MPGADRQSAKVPVRFAVRSPLWASKRCSHSGYPSSLSGLEQAGYIQAGLTYRNRRTACNYEAETRSGDTGRQGQNLKAASFRSGHTAKQGAYPAWQGFWVRRIPPYAPDAAPAALPRDLDSPVVYISYPYLLLENTGKHWRAWRTPVR